MDRPSQVDDITYLPMRRGFLYLVAIMDWYTRKVLAWRISDTFDADFSLQALKEAIHRFDPLEIMNMDQGSQLTFFAWTDRLKRGGTGHQVGIAEPVGHDRGAGVEDQR